MAQVTSFDTNWRRIQELKGRPYIDSIYREVLHAVKIIRFDDTSDELHILDRRYGIDTELTLPTGHILTVQEKVLSHKYSGFNTVTFEYMNNPLTSEVGDWFTLCADLYFVAYFNEDQTDFEKWAILDVPILKLSTLYGWIKWGERPNTAEGARATFRYVDVGTLPAKCVVRQIGFKQEATHE